MHEASGRGPGLQVRPPLCSVLITSNAAGSMHLRFSTPLPLCSPNAAPHLLCLNMKSLYGIMRHAAARRAPGHDGPFCCCDPERTGQVLHLFSFLLEYGARASDSAGWGSLLALQFEQVTPLFFICLSHFALFLLLASHAAVCPHVCRCSDYTCVDSPYFLEAPTTTQNNGSATFCFVLRVVQSTPAVTGPCYREMSNSLSKIGWRISE